LSVVRLSPATRRDIADEAPLLARQRGCTAVDVITEGEVIEDTSDK
jgi:hypothetical protein